jgi:ubiquinone/menaquinone biosynthesis C-methylase UbiE
LEENEMRILFALLICLPSVFAQNPSAPRNKEGIDKMHQDPKAYIAMLENPQRDAEQKPDEVIKTLNLKEDASIADIGAGSGYFSFRFARHVGASGRVYAVDINPDMILYMNRHIRETKIKNVTTVLSDPDNPLLLDNSIDLFFVCNTWHHVSNRPQYLVLMKKMLKPGGRIAVVDYKKEKLPVGPPPEMKMAREEVIKEMQAAGFKLSAEHSFLPYQYFLEFR